jgi:hypothetical protein
MGQKPNPSGTVACQLLPAPPDSPSSAQTSSVDYKVTRSRRTRSIRWEESIRNFGAADRTRMERQEGIFREGVAFRRSRFNKARLLLKDCIDQVVDQFSQQIVPANV